MDFLASKKPSKWEKEQAVRREKLKKKKAEEDAAKARYAEQEQNLARLAEKRRLEEEEKTAERESARLAEDQLTGGISMRDVLSVRRVEEGEDDKCVLPESWLTSLSEKDAISRGAMMFRLELQPQNMQKRPHPVVAAQIEGQEMRRTHCGVREFTGDEGTVGLPDKVLASLGLEGMSSEALIDAARRVDIRYVRLPKIKLVKFQPVLNRFFNLGPVKLVLEQNLRFHTTLSLGDLVTVWHRGMSYELRVADMFPEPFGSLIDTDVEVELGLSDEYVKSDEYAQEMQKAAAKSEPVSSSLPSSTPVRTPSSSSSSSSSSRLATPASLSIPHEHGTSGDGPSTEAAAAFIPLPVPDEPHPSEPTISTVFCKIKTPSHTLVRTFRGRDAFQSVFNLVRNAHDGGSGRLVVSTRAPAREFIEWDQENSGKTFQDLGFGGSKQLFIASFT